MATQKNKKRKRRLNREQLRQTIAPTKDFDFVNPHDEDDIIVVTAQRLSPGHLLEMNSSSLIKAYQEKPDEVPQDSENDETVPGEILENFEVIVNNVKNASEIASMTIIDPETGERLYTKEDCMLYFLPEWNTQIANWALAGAKPQEGEEADNVDRIPAADVTSESELSENPE